MQSCGIVKVHKGVAMAQRKQFSWALKAKVAVEAIRSQKTTDQITSVYQVRPNQVYESKKASSGASAQGDGR